MKNFFQLVLLLLLCTSLKAQYKNVFDVARKGTLIEMEAIYKQKTELVDAVNDNKATPKIIVEYFS